MTTGSIGGFIGDPDALQVISFASGGQSVSLNFFTVLGVNYATVPTAATGMAVRFYTLPGITTSSSINDTVAALATAVAGTPTATVTSNLSPVAAAGSYNYTIGSAGTPINQVLPSTVAVRVTFFTDTTYATETNGTSLSRGRYSTGVVGTGTAQPFSFSDDDGDNVFSAAEAFVGQSSPLVPLNIRIAMDATVIPEPATLSLLAGVGLVALRRRAH